MSIISKDDVLLMRLMSEWKKQNQPFISVDAGIYNKYLTRFHPSHTVHDGTGRPVLFLLEKESTIKGLCDEHDLKA